MKTKMTTEELLQKFDEISEFDLSGSLRITIREMLCICNLRADEERERVLAELRSEKAEESLRYYLLEKDCDCKSCKRILKALAIAKQEGRDEREAELRGKTVERILREDFNDREPGEQILAIDCPCCGSELSIEFGDDDGQIGVLGDCKTPEWNKEMIEAKMLQKWRATDAEERLEGACSHMPRLISRPLIRYECWLCRSEALAIARAQGQPWPDIGGCQGCGKNVKPELRDREGKMWHRICGTINFGIVLCVPCGPITEIPESTGPVIDNTEPFNESLPTHHTTNCGVHQSRKCDCQC